MVLGAALLQSNMAIAQTQTAQQDVATPLSGSTSTEKTSPPSAPEKNAIIVTGQRRALRTSQQIKRNADTVVDSITATDIGAFPDKSVAEALQRVPGITVNRFAATSDTAHFSAEPSGVIIRGLPQVRSEFNGRDTFSANSSRGLSWTDITPELLAGVDVYKNQTADMIEGGIAGSVDLRTRVPFDAPGQLIQVGARANYGDLDKKWTPDLNGFYSNRWQTGAGEFGLMGDLAYSHVKTRSQGIQYGRTAIIEHGAPDWPAEVFWPASINFLNNEYDRKRYGISAAGQWKSNSGKVLATAQYLRSLYKNNWRERTLGSFGLGPDLYSQDVFTRVNSGSLPGQIPIEAPGTPDFVFDSNGNFEAGTPNKQGPIWWGAPPNWAGSGSAPGINVGYGVNDQGQPMFNSCNPGNTQAIGCVIGPNGQANYGTDVGTGSRINQNRSMTQDAALNVKWDPTNDLHFNFDGQYVKSKVDNYDLSMEFHSFANTTLDATGELPRISFSPPTNINQSEGGLSNPDNWYVRSISDHLEDSKGHEWALRADGQYDFHTDWLSSLKFGGRFADRKQLVQWSTYNWQNIANTWTDCDPGGTGTNPHPYFNLDSQPGGTCISTGETFKGYPSGFYEVDNFGTPFFGGSMGKFPFVPFSFLEQHKADLFSFDLTGVGQFVPICQRNGQVPGVTPVEIDNSCFTPNEIANVEEKTKAGYAMLKFGGPDAMLGSIKVSGNIGLRYVQTDDSSSGAVRYPTISGDRTLCPHVAAVPGGIVGNAPLPGEPGFNDPNHPRPPGTAYYPAYCYLNAGDVAFASGGGTLTSASNSFHNFLPSFNIRFDLTPKWLVRFAASKAISRPDIGLLKNFVDIGLSLPASNQLSDPRWTIGPDGQPTGVNPTYTAQAFNPYLKPTSAWQYDLSIENYFANVGQFSFAIFYKKFKDYIQYGVFNQNIANGDTTRTVRVTGPANGSGATIKGAEIDYQRFFDFLPGVLSGLGIQANATYVKNSGVPNSALTPVGATGEVTNPGNAHTALNPGTLEGLSKWTYNLVGMYEKGRVSARVAYNWRSKYLVTVVDCCVYLPVWQKASGFLDASLRYRLNDAIEFSIEGSNLLNTKTKLLQQVTDTTSPEGKIILTPNAWFQNDRRFILGERWKMADAAAPPPPPPVMLPPPPPATQTCPDGSVVDAAAACPMPPPPAAPPPPPPATVPERGY
ncbi:MAG: TonB-dependent receptor [Sphingomonas sp.]